MSYCMCAVSHDGEKYLIVWLQICWFPKILTHCGLVTPWFIRHLGRHRFKLCSASSYFSVGSLGTNTSEIMMRCLHFSSMKLHMKMLSAKWCPLYLGPNVLKTLCTGIFRLTLQCGINTVRLPIKFQRFVLFRIFGIFLSLTHCTWPSDAIWWHRPGSTSIQVVACCMAAPSHHLNQCWLLISEVMWHSPESNFTASDQAIILYDEFKN